MKTLRKLLVSISLVFTGINISSASFLETHGAMYEDQIKEHGREIMKKYLQWDKLNTFSKDPSQNEGNESYKKYISDTVDALIKREKIDKNTTTPEFKILDEYNRIINTEKIPSGDTTTNISPVPAKEWISVSQKATTPAITTLATLTALYNRTNAVNYAYTWVFNRNSSYSYYSWLNDCTNFTSQVLKAGWLSDVTSDTSSGERTGKINWYYGAWWQLPTYTWWGAENFFQHAAYTTSRYQTKPYFWDLQVGDILQADWGYDGFGAKNHSMVVTKKLWTATNQIYLTYHNEYNITANDRRDKLLSEILAVYPTSANNYYVWSVIY